MTLYYEKPVELRAGFAYLMGDLRLDDDFPPAVGCVGVAEHIEISLIIYSPKKFYPASKPMDFYIQNVITKDDRIKTYLGEHAKSLKLLNIRGTRLRSRDLCKDISIDGAIAIGDTWVSGAQLGNVNALAHGIYAGRELKKAFERKDFSKESLSRVARFIHGDTEKTIKQITKMFDYPLLMDEETTTKYFEIFHSMNYPTFFFGSKWQIEKMVMSCMLRNSLKLMANRGMFKYL